MAGHLQRAGHQVTVYNSPRDVASWAETTRITRVTMRPSTEWVDTVELGANTLVDDDPDRLEEAARSARMPHERPELYGDGHASERIARSLMGSLSPA